MGEKPVDTTELSEAIGLTDGCPSTPKVVKIGIAADCNYVKRYQTQDSARSAILNSLNSVSELYQSSFNISLSMVELFLQNSTCPSNPDPNLPWNVACSPKGPTLDARLNHFSRWRVKERHNDGAGLWHLMTDCPSGEEVGVASLGTLCQSKSEDTGPVNEIFASRGVGPSVTQPRAISGTAVTSASPNEWQIMAHEIAHNFGATHDCGPNCQKTDECCPFSRDKCYPEGGGPTYLMAAQTSGTSGSTGKFSPCTIGNVCQKLGGHGSLDTSCLS